MTRAELVAAVHEVGKIVNGQVRPNYSGPWMHGATCFGVVCPERQMVRTIEEAAARGLKGARLETVETGMVVYWPIIKGEA